MEQNACIITFLIHEGVMCWMISDNSNDADFLKKFQGCLIAEINKCFTLKLENSGVKVR